MQQSFQVQFFLRGFLQDKLLESGIAENRNRGSLSSCQSFVFIFSSGLSVLDIWYITICMRECLSSKWRIIFLDLSWVRDIGVIIIAFESSVFVFIKQVDWNRWCLYFWIGKWNGKDSYSFQNKLDLYLGNPVANWKYTRKRSFKSNQPLNREGDYIYVGEVIEKSQDIPFKFAVDLKRHFKSRPTKMHLIMLKSKMTISEMRSRLKPCSDG